MSNRNSFDAIRSIVGAAQDALETAIADTPDALVNSLQPGRSNSIGAIYAHALLSLDMFYNTALCGKEQVLVSANFAHKLGLQDTGPFNWDALKATAWDISVLKAYAQAVYAGVNAYLADLTDAELGRAFKLFEQDATVEGVIALATWHTAFHAGEIAALKGVNGLLGLPF